MKYENVRNFLLNEARAIILDFLPENSCVSSTRICIEAFKMFGIKARAEVVYLVAAKNGLSIVGQNPHEDPSGWNGHMVCLTRTEILDLSLGQIGLPPSTISWDGEIFPVTAIIDGIPVVYFLDPHPVWPYQTEAWNENWRPAWEEIERLLKEKSAIL